MSNKPEAVKAAMQGLWLQQLVASKGYINEDFGFYLDATGLAVSSFNPLDIVRAQCWVNEDFSPDGDECISEEQAAAITGLNHRVFCGGEMPTLTAEQWERGIGRLVLTAFAHSRNRLRLSYGCSPEEMEDVLSAADRFLALAESSVKIDATPDFLF